MVAHRIWTEAARLQLVGAVMKVEKEIMINDSKNSSQQMGRFKKWHAIASLLPEHLRAKQWNSSLPKCYNVFHNLVKGYKDKITGKRGLVNLSEPVCRLLKRREDLLNGRDSLPMERRLRPGSAKRVNGSNNCGVTVQPLLKADSSDGSVHEESDAPAQEVIEGSKDFDLGNRKGKEKEKFPWTETALILVIEAVIKVEEEARNGSSKSLLSSTGRTMGKWERVDRLLPLRVCPRGRIWTREKGKCGKYKCERFFDCVLQNYRVFKRRKGYRKHYLLTEPVCKLFEKLLNARASSRPENSLQSESPDNASTSIGLGNEQKPMSATRDNSMCLDTNQALELSSDGPSLGTGTEGDRSLPEHTDHSESTEKAPKFDDNNLVDMEPNHISHKNSTGLDADSSLRRSLRSFSLTLDFHDNENKSPSSTLGCASRSEGDSKNPDDKFERTAGPEVRTRAASQTPERDLISPTNPPSKQVRASSTVRKSTDSNTERRYNKHLRKILDGPLRRLDLEFSRLSSWISTQSVPVGTQLMDEMNNSERRAGKRRKLNFGGSSAEPLDALIHESRSRFMDLHIRAAFQKLRIRFAEELQNTCAELTRELQQGIRLLPNSPSPDDVRRRRSQAEEFAKDNANTTSKAS